jgi:hypothetical protein
MSEGIYRGAAEDIGIEMELEERLAEEEERRGSADLAMAILQNSSEDVRRENQKLRKELDSMTPMSGDWVWCSHHRAPWPCDEECDGTHKLLYFKSDT